MNNLRFADPQWIHLTWGVLLLAALLVGLELRGKSALDRFLSQVMQPRLIRSVSAVRRFTALVLLVLALLSLVCAAMRPQWGEMIRVMPQVGAQIMVCLDVSKSMLAEDTVPNRLGRAKAELVDLLDLLRGERVGLIAFAGKATVVSPMTSDFGFLKLILEHVGPHSIGRGGTRLEEPIRKAIDGFGDAADISRVILLITDGEDHDSFPLEAADAARERGIKIITIGFGDEAGSKIQITDPRTGVRSFVTDSAGNEVISRLDGETLREIALRTEGAYIPAGTGALDLASIHRQHIAPLMRGELASGQQVIREEAYQWAVLAAVVFLALSLIVMQSGQRASPLEYESTSAAPVAAMFALCVFGLSTATFAQQSPPEPPPEAEASNVTEMGQAPAVATLDGHVAKGVDVTDEGDSVDPRATYNQSIVTLASNPDRSEVLLQKARRHAGSDGEVRYRSAYNLGWVAVHRADALLEDEPENALKRLHEAADWFRESIRIRPKDKDARHNLEIVMRRAMELADSLAQKNERDVATQLDQLIDEQRELIGQAGQVVERYSDIETPPTDNNAMRRDFRGLSTLQRQILSDTQALAKQIAEEIGGLQQRQPDELTQEERLRAAQLAATAVDVGRATQRLGQARSQFRRRESQRGFRRATYGLEELKRARDNLREPHEVLQRLVTDTQSLIGKTNRKAMAANDLMSSTATQVPSWLTKELLEQSQAALTDRSRTWAAQMKDVLAARDPDEGGTNDDNPQTDANNVILETQKQRIRPAADMVAQAANRLEEAGSQIHSEQYATAAERQAEAYRLLTDAYELFLDLKGLIEAAFATEQQIQQYADAWDRLNTDQRHGLAATFAELQRKNLQRADRLDEEIEFELQQLTVEPEAAPPPPPTGNATGAPNPTTSNTDTQQRAAEESRLQQAKALLQRARTNMLEVAAALVHIGAEPNPPRSENRTGDDMINQASSLEETKIDDPTEEDEDMDAKLDPDDEQVQDPDEDDGSDAANENDEAEGDETEKESHGFEESRKTLVANVSQAVDRLQEMRRLFFSIVDHLRETAQRQSDLNDETQQLTTSTGESLREQQFGAIGDEQANLEQVSREISQALQQQAAQAPTAGVDSQQDATNAQAISQKYAQAAELVANSAELMAEASELIAAQREVPEIRQPQDQALQKLSAALALLVPPHEQNNEQDQRQQQQPNQDQPQQDNQQQQQQQQQQQNMSANQLLQMIRDREAQRRRNQEQRAAAREPVDKDW